MNNNTANTETMNLEKAVEILISKITHETSDAAAETLLNAVHYLRAGKYRFNRTTPQPING